MLTLHRVTNKKEENLFLQTLQDNNLPTQDVDFHRFHFFFVQNEANENVATVAYEAYGNEAILRSLAVIGEQKNKGVGTKTVQLLEKEAKKNAIQQLFLLTTTADIFFQKQHYALCDRKNVPENIANASEFQSVCPASAICLSKLLI